MLSMMILGLKQIRDDRCILKFFIEDLRKLKEEDTNVIKNYSSETFKLRDMLFFINKFQTYDNFFDYNIKRHKIYPICEEKA